MNRLVILGQSNRMDLLYWSREYALTGYTGAESEQTGYAGTQRMYWLEQNTDFT